MTAGVMHPNQDRENKTLRFLLALDTILRVGLDVQRLRNVENNNPQMVNLLKYDNMKTNSTEVVAAFAIVDDSLGRSMA